MYVFSELFHSSEYTQRSACSLNLERDLAERAGQDKIRGQPKPLEP